jgi:hypothetical protein
MKNLFLPLALITSGVFAADPAPALKPLMAVPDKIVMQDDFSKAGTFNKQQWGARQGTQWVVEEGVLRGKPSTPEYQASRKDHFGYEPRISAPVTPPQFIAQFSVRFIGGAETAISPFIEFGHHVCRLRLSKDGMELLADGDSVRVAESKDLKFEPGKWYHALAEMKGGEFVIQFAGGPTIHAKHESFAKAPARGGNGLGIAGTKGGTVEIDDVTLWSIKADEQPGWSAKLASFPKFQPVEIPKGKAKAKAE